MTLISNAINSSQVAKVVGYQLKKGDFALSSPNLPQRIAIFGQANTANQGGLTNDPVQITSQEQAGNLFGYGSQIHIISRILRSINSDILGGVPTIVYPQLAPSGGVAAEREITVTGTAADKNGQISVLVNGRSVVDGFSLIITIASGDTPTDVAGKIRDAINASLPCPVTASAAAGVVTCSCKWVGEASEGLNIEIDTGDDALSLGYAIASTATGVGDSSTEISSSLALFADNWNTIVINPYAKSTNSLFEDFNGVPGEDPGTGRYAADVWKPFVCLTGNKAFDTVANVTTNLDQDQGTIVQCAAPNSNGWAFEAAANVAALLGQQAQENPALDVSGKTYLDMPIPADEQIGVYGDINDRDLLVKGGASTVTISAGSYIIEDLITTYAPTGETPPQFRYVRTLMQDFNVRYGYFLLEQREVLDKTIVASDQFVRQKDTVKPEEWAGVVYGYADDLAERAIISDPQFMKGSVQVGVSDTNPDRFETSFSYKRTGFVRIASTTATAGFAFGVE